MWPEIRTGTKVTRNTLWINIKIGETQEASTWSWKALNWVISGFCVSIICHKDKLQSCHFVLWELQVPRGALQRWEIIRTNDTAGFWSCCVRSLPAPLAVSKGNSDVEAVIWFSFFSLPGLLWVLQNLLCCLPRTHLLFTQWLYMMAGAAWLWQPWIQFVCN